ncbi:MAG: hypothetical protein IAE82_07050 [Opitutaceae bacterium]|nr:hypothetical protein [Opitutaceae bacterium]
MGTRRHERHARRGSSSDPTGRDGRDRWPIGPLEVGETCAAAGIRAQCALSSAAPCQMTAGARVLSRAVAAVVIRRGAVSSSPSLHLYSSNTGESMPTSKITVAALLDHGPLVAAEATGLKLAATAAPEASDVMSDEAVARVIRAVAVDKKTNLTAVRAIRTVKSYAALAQASIAARYALLGGAKGFLGATQTTVTPCPDRVGYFQHYAGGSIYWSPRTGAHEVHGLIRQRWAQLGWERSFLGYPTTDETTGRDSRHEGRFNHFLGGSLYWHPAVGVHEVHGAIRAKYLELGAEASFLGYPTTDETATPDRVGRFNHFQAGSIYWTPRTGAHEVHGLIRGKWAELGWERNAALGYPITDELIPHRGVGYTRPVTVRKPGLAIPLDLIRLPEEQPPEPPEAAPMVMATPVVMTASATRARTLTAVAATRPAVTAVRPGIGGLVVRPDLIGGLNPVASHKGQSQDRYSDFENGVVFWQRGQSSAVVLAPRAQAPDGTRVAWTGAEIAALATPKIKATLAGLGGATVVGVNVAGTTGYSHDGAGLHNRAHRLHVMLQGMVRLGLTPVPAIATVEVRVEVGLDPVDREVVGYLAGWSLLASQGDFLGGGSLVHGLHQRLDAALWHQFLIASIKPKDGDPIAILSVKTHADGRVVTYFEP